MDWLSQHHDSLTVLTSFGTLLIWLVYAQLLYKGYQRQRRPRLIINRGKNKDINALCIISNMSAEPVFIEYIVAELETSRGRIVMDITDFERDYDGKSDDDEESESAQIPERVRDNTRQGPLQPGDYLHIGTFRNIIRRMARQANIEMQGFRPVSDFEFERLTIQLIGIYGPEDLPMGAERSFDLHATDEQCDLSPQSWDTQHKNSRRQRYKLRAKLEQLNHSPFTVSPTLQDSE